MEAQFSGEKPQHTRPYKRETQGRGDSRATNFNTTNHTAKSGLTLRVGVLPAKRGRSEGFQSNIHGHDHRKKPSPRPHHKATKPPGWTSLVPGCSLQAQSGCRAEQGTRPPWESKTGDNPDARKREEWPRKPRTRGSSAGWTLGRGPGIHGSAGATCLPGCACPRERAWSR